MDYEVRDADQRAGVKASSVRVSSNGVVSVSPRDVARSSAAKAQVRALEEFAKAGGLRPKAG